MLNIFKLFELILGYTRYSKKHSRFSIFLNSVLFVFLLLSVSFSAFLYFAQYPAITEEVFYVFGGLFVVAFLLILPFFWGRGCMYIAVSLALGAIAYITLNKYLANDIGQYAAYFLESHVDEQVRMFIALNGNIIAAFLLAFLLFEILPQYSCTLLIMLNICLFAATAGIINMGLNQESPEVFERNSPTKNAKIENKNFIYIILSEHFGYAYAKEMQNNDVAYIPKLNTKIDFIEDFYRKYKFSFYPHVYSTVDDTAKSIAGVMNFNSTRAEKHFDKWQGGDLILTDGIKMPFANNELFSLFKSNDFDLTVYQSKYIDLCHFGGKEVNKCYTYGAYPGKIYETKINVLNKAYLLVGHWLAIHKLQLNDVVMNISKQLNKTGKELPIIDFPVDETYPIGQLEILDKIKEDILKAKNKQVFIAHLLLPHHPYVYDENCSLIENPKDWLSNKKIFSNSKRMTSVEAYTNQLSCVYKKLDETFSELHKNSVLDNSVVIIHGDRGFGLTFDDETMKNETIREKVERKVKDRLSTIMAIYDPSKKEYELNLEGCDTATILEQYLFGQSQEGCKEIILDKKDEWIRESIEKWFSYSPPVFKSTADKIKEIEQSQEEYSPERTEASKPTEDSSQYDPMLQ